MKEGVGWSQERCLDVDVVADGSAVAGAVVTTKHVERGPDAQRGLVDVRHQVVRHTLRMLADGACAGAQWIEAWGPLLV